MEAVTGAGADGTGTTAVEARRNDLSPAARIERFLDLLLGNVAAICLLGIILDVLAGVVSRYAFHRAFTWTEEAAIWLFGYLIFAAMPLAVRRSRHLALGIAKEFLPAARHGQVDFLVDFVIVYTSIRLFAASWIFTSVSSGTSITLGIPAWLQYAIIPVSAGFLLIYHMLEAFTGKRPTALALGAIAAATAAYLIIDVYELTGIRSGEPTLVLGLAMLITLLLGVPVAICLLFAAFLASDAGNLLPPAAVVQNVVVGSSKFVLLAIPLFIVAAFLMNSGGMTIRLINLARAAVGRFRGGLAQVNIATSVLFAFDSGSSSADAALLAKMMVPQMEKNGYPADFACGLSAASAILPSVIPPSIALLLFASIADVSVGKLFVAGIVPGLMIAGLLMTTAYVISRRRGYGQNGSAGATPRLSPALLYALPALMLSVIILGGIRFGLVTATEAGAVAVIYALFLGIFVYRDFDMKRAWSGFVECAIDSAVVGFLVGVAAPFAWVLIAGRIPQMFLAMMVEHVSQPWVILLVLNGVMLIAGTLLDVTAIMLIIVPIAMPLVLSLGVDPIHFGIIVIVNLMLGGLTPPYGLQVFIPSAITGTPVRDTFRAARPFLLILIAGLLLMTYVPAISLFLVDLLF